MWYNVRVCVHLKDYVWVCFPCRSFGGRPTVLVSYYPRGALSGIVQSLPGANLETHFDTFSPQYIQIG